MGDRVEVKKAIEQWLACPQCHGPLVVRETRIECHAAACGFTGALADGVATFRGRGESSFFDERHDVMHRGNRDMGVQELCYAQQAAVIARCIPEGSMVLDVGCGPALAYPKPPGCVVIGVDASYVSVTRNADVDLRVHATAETLPLPDGSVDVIVCLYSVHHMVGETVAENAAVVRRVFNEFARVVKSGGELLVFEVSPWWPLWVVERALWDAAKRLLGRRLDMFFWSERAVAQLVGDVCPRVSLETTRFESSWGCAFPPMFNVPWLKIPRLLYPFSVRLYRWRF